MAASDPRSALIDAARNGDQGAFAQLLDEDAPAAYRTAMAVLGSPADAEDVVQEAAIRAWQHLPKLRTPAAWRSWFRQIVVRLALDHARKSSTRNRERALAPTRESVSPHERKAEEITMMDAIGRLAPIDRAVIGLRYGADLEVADMARLLGIRVGTAKSRIHRALARLRKELDADAER